MKLCWLEKHDYRVVGANPVRTIDTFGGEVIGDSRDTDVLYRCSRCGKVRSETIKGRWTLEALNGEAKC